MCNGDRSHSHWTPKRPDKRTAHPPRSLILPCSISATRTVCQADRVGCASSGGGGAGVSIACCRPACARSRSCSGLLTTFSSVKRLRAEMGGQLRIRTESSIRSSVIAYWTTHRVRTYATGINGQRTVLLVMHEKLGTPEYALAKGWSNMVSFRADTGEEWRDVLWICAHLASELVEHPARHSHRRRLVHKSDLGDKAREGHGRHLSERVKVQSWP